MLKIVENYFLILVITPMFTKNATSLKFQTEVRRKISVIIFQTLDGADNVEEENEISPKDQMRLLMLRFEVFKKWGQLPNKKFVTFVYIVIMM